MNFNLYGPELEYEYLIYHLDFRFDYQDDQMVLLSNYWNNDIGDYGPGERINLPVNPGDSFKLVVVNEGSFFNVFIDDVYTVKFDNINPSLALQNVWVEGDVTIEMFTCPLYKSVYNPVRITQLPVQ